MSQFKPDVLIGIPVNEMEEFFKHWFTFLKPIHGLTNKPMQVAVCFLKYRYELSKKINDEELLDSVLFNEDTKRAIRHECGLQAPHFHVIMSLLRKSNVIVDDKINKRFIPNIKSDGNTFQLSFLFNFNKHE